MNQPLSSFAARLREIFFVGDNLRGLCSSIADGANNEPSHVGSCGKNFESLALDLFALQFEHNLAYRKICKSRKFTPESVELWAQIPAVPTSAFKEMELTSLAPGERTTVFHSSGTTEQKPSRHFHNAESLAVYEASLWSWFAENVVAGSPSTGSARESSDWKLADAVLGVPSAQPARVMLLTPPPAQVPHSSLVHMFEIVRQKMRAAESGYCGKLAEDGAWTLDFEAVVEVLSAPGDEASPPPLLLLGTAFSFVHLMDHLTENHLQFQLPEGSRVMETGGYKNRSRTMPKAELHELITQRLGIPAESIVCEYGMSELSSQAYDAEIHPPVSIRHPRAFRFPPWARVQIISPETGCEVAEGETGLIRVFDLANVYSVAAVQTEDLGIRRGDGFELVGRAQHSEPRGCSLMTA